MTKKSAETPKTSAEWQALIERLEGRLEEIAGQREELEKSKRPLALPAASGDEEAARQLRAVNQRLAGLDIERGDIGLALDQATHSMTQALAGEARGREVERLQRLRRLAKDRVKAAGEVEAALGTLAEKVAALHELTGAMDGLLPPDDRTGRADINKWRTGLARMASRALEKPYGVYQGGTPIAPDDMRLADEVARGEAELTDADIERLASGGDVEGGRAA